MANKLQTLAQISSEIDESEIKVTFANQCVKAQDSLATKLKDEIQRRKDICKFKKNENLKLEAELKNAELEILNSRINYESISSANTERKKELMLIKERKAEITERIKKGEKKYEDIWTQCKNRYESLPSVQNLMQKKKKIEDLNNDILIIENETQSLKQAVRVKKDENAEKDKNLIVQLANLFVHEVPEALKTLKEKNMMINELSKEIENLTKEIKAKDAKTNKAALEKTAQTPEEENTKTCHDNWSIDNTLMVPKLQLPSVDMDIINVKLDINKVTLHTSPPKRTISLTELENNTSKKSKPDENLTDNYISCYFNTTSMSVDGEQKNDSTEDYSNKKLINIIEDIHIDNNEAYKLVSKVNVDQFHEINVITASKKAKEFIKSAKVQALEIEEVEEIDVPSSNQQDLLVPPTQFWDPTQDKGNESTQQEVVDANETSAPSKDINISQKEVSKKVSFDISTKMQDESDAINLEELEKPEGDTPNDTVGSQLDLSEITDDNYMAIKDMILKKQHQLDLSPQFVYSKNTFQKKDDEPVIRSKFFDTACSNNKDAGKDDISKASEDEQNNTSNHQENEQAQEEQVEIDKSPVAQNVVTDMDVDNAVSSPKDYNGDKPVSGLLYTHGPQGITDFDISMSTTGYEEGDIDFPTCLDSSLLLSPKADLPMPMSGNPSETGSQDLPSFLTGFRKAGMSFFKQKPADTNAENSNQNENNNFNFNFGSDDKKNKRGLFSFFQ